MTETTTISAAYHLGRSYDPYSAQVEGDAHPALSTMRVPHLGGRSKQRVHPYRPVLTDDGYVVCYVHSDLGPVAMGPMTADQVRDFAEGELEREDIDAVLDAVEVSS